MEAFNIAGETRAKPILEFISNSANEYGDQIGKAVDQFAP